MPLNPSGLQTDLQTIAATPPATVALCAQAWANAMGAYTAAILPASTTVNAAKATLQGALTTAFGSSAAAPGMETAFAAFATTVGAGMLPAFVATPPPAPVGFAAQFAGPKPPTHAAAAAQLKTLIDTWMRTGTATPSGGGAPVNWS